ncbi:MAG: membrane protein insertase YidC [Bacteroidales bacterium]|nr:membrane protein insertase YidC [Bacteroidales bacterium]
MDKNTVIGLVLIIAIFIGFNIWMRPSKEELAQQQRVRDSIAAVNAEKAAENLRIEEAMKAQENVEEAINDSLRGLKFGAMAAATNGTEEMIQVENEKLRLQFSSKGGMITSAELKQFVTGDSLPLILFDNELENHINFTLLTTDNRILSSDELYFVAQPVVVSDSAMIYTLRSSVNEESWLDFVYTIPHNDYMIHFAIVPHNMGRILDPLATSIEMDWDGMVRQQERGRKFESRYTALNYRFVDDDQEQLSESRNASKDVSTPLMWIAFKDQFFSTIIIPDDEFLSAKMTSEVMSEREKYIKHFNVSTSLPFDVRDDSQPTGFRIYLGPNHYKVLASYDKNVEKADRLHLEHLVPLGWKAFRWISKWFIIPMFNFFGRFINNYGIIILLMTLVIKLVLFPFTFKSYMSSAKMRVLKPQIDALNEKYPGPEKAMERQQAQMQLYNKAGISPMGGCLPMLLQMPILVAMFQFFPTAFELRGQSFLWAKDLSSYDAIVEWGFNIPLIGNHISLFCLLMTITNIIYTKINMSSQAGSNEQMAMMKWMMYLMPVFFFFMFNDYASGLSYYYFVALLFTIVQTMVIRLMVDDEKVLAQLESNKARPQKKSKFMQRLEAAQKEQEKMIREQAKKNARK